jgi:hypothetical protein
MRKLRMSFGTPMRLQRMRMRKPTVPDRAVLIDYALTSVSETLYVEQRLRNRVEECVRVTRAIGKRQQRWAFRKTAG